MTTVAITGGTGFIGQHLLTRLLDAGYAVRALARGTKAPSTWSDRIEVISGDLNDKPALERLCTGADIVIHLAGAIKATSRAAFFATNEVGTINIAAAASEAGVKRFVLVSSLAARVPELSDYAASKNAAERAAREALPAKKLIIARPPAIYGDGDRETFALFKALDKSTVIIPGNLRQNIAWMHVEDLTNALIALATLPDVKGETFELSDARQKGYRWQEIVATAARIEGKNKRLYMLPRALVTIAAHATQSWSRLTGKTHILSPGKVNEIYHPDWAANPSPIPGWQPQISLADGFARTFSWYRQNGWLPPPGDPAKGKGTNGHKEVYK